MVDQLYLSRRLVCAGELGCGEAILCPPIDGAISHHLPAIPAAVRSSPHR